MAQSGVEISVLSLRFRNVRILIETMKEYTITKFDHH
jgi:hypothetical protein